METGFIESTAAIPLTEALARWRREAQFGERWFAWGRGQPLLFVHGLADQARSFVPVIAHLTDAFRCIAYELPDDARRHAEFAEHSIALLDQLKIGQACLYGASFGATVALRALHDSPWRFLRAALQSGFAAKKLGPGELALASLMRFWPGRLRDLPLFARWQRRADAAAFERSPADVWDFQRSNSGTTAVRTFARRALIVGQTDLRPLLSAIRQPILLISGDRDTVVGRAAADELAAGLPHADRLEFANCGHYAQYTHAPGVAAALRRFLLPPCGLTG